jgi:hypothetical protein
VATGGSPRPGLPVGSVQGLWVRVACMGAAGGGVLVLVCTAREGVKNRQKMTKTRKVVKNTFSGAVPRGRPPGLKTHTHRGHTTPTTDFGFGAVGTPGANEAHESRFPTHFGPDRHLPPQGQSGRVRLRVPGYGPTCWVRTSGSRRERTALRHPHPSMGTAFHYNMELRCRAGGGCAAK